MSVRAKRQQILQHIESALKLSEELEEHFMSKEWSAGAHYLATAMTNTLRDANGIAKDIPKVPDFPANKENCNEQNG